MVTITLDILSRSFSGPLSIFWKAAFYVVGMHIVICFCM